MSSAIERKQGEAAEGRAVLKMDRQTDERGYSARDCSGARWDEDQSGQMK